MLKEKLKEIYYYSSLSVVAQWLTSVFILAPYFHVLHRTTVRYIGKKLNKKQNYIFVSNHKSLKDPPLLGLATMLPVAFVAKKELFSNPLLSFFMYATSTISVDREAAETQTFKAAKKALNAKALGYAWNLGIFIEGTRSTDPEYLGRPNKGAIFIARLTKTPIVPIGISYKSKKEIEIVFGEPYEIDYKGDLDDQAWQCLEKISNLCTYKMPNR